MVKVTLGLVVAEYCLLTWYLPTVEEAVEADGAFLSIVPTALLCLSGWVLTTKWESRSPSGHRSGGCFAAVGPAVLCVDGQVVKEVRWANAVDRRGLRAS